MLTEDNLAIILRSLFVSFSATIGAALLAYPASYATTLMRGLPRHGLTLLMQSLMATPPVVVGLGLYLLFAPAGPLGASGWIYSVKIMVLAQLLLAFPIIFTLSFDALHAKRQEFRGLIDAFPPSFFLSAKMLFFEARLALLTAFIAGFARSIAEVGAVMIVGGNIEGLTQIMTTFILQETGKGNIADAMWLGVVLFLISIAVTLLSLLLRRVGLEAHHG